MDSSGISIDFPSFLFHCPRLKLQKCKKRAEQRSVLMLSLVYARRACSPFSLYLPISDRDVVLAHSAWLGSTLVLLPDLTSECLKNHI